MIINNFCQKLGAWLFVVGLTGCQPAPEQHSPPAPASAAVTTTSAPLPASQPTQSPSKKTPIEIDWATVDSGEKAVDKAHFNYPFTLDSEPVKAYADVYHVDANTARYNLTVGMAVNEVLNKILDQIGTAYVSHELTAGRDSQFIIHTTQTVRPSEHDYVFAEPFAKGLTLRVKVINDGVKGQQPNPHTALANSASQTTP